MDDAELWLSAHGLRTMKLAGLREGQIVLDFGCGSGNYTIPSAILVGPSGLVYAIDMDEQELRKLINRISEYGLKNVVAIKTDGGAEIPLINSSLDVILLYDVFHFYFFPSLEDRLKLLKEVSRVLKRNGFVSLYPKHTSIKSIIREFALAGFDLVDEVDATLIHEDYLERNKIMKFKKS